MSDPVAVTARLWVGESDDEKFTHFNNPSQAASALMNTPHVVALVPTFFLARVVMEDMKVSEEDAERNLTAAIEGLLHVGQS